MAELLYKLREWLAIPEAAASLSSDLGQNVTEDEILRLGLEGRLRLSVRFLNHVHGRLLRRVPRDDAEVRRTTHVGELVTEKRGDYDFSETEVLLYIDPDKVLLRDGLWDLPMFGNERAHVENRCQTLTGGPTVTPLELGGSDRLGAFVTRPDGTWFQLCDAEFEEEARSV